MSLSTAQIAAQLEAVLNSDATLSALAIHAPAPEPWPQTLSQRGRQFALRWCESSLAVREALCELERQDSAAGLVVLTPLATHEIADDIAARLARARVFEPDAWDTVRQQFQAREIDARLGRFAWMPQLLIDAAVQGTYPPAANGFLSLEAAWGELLRRCLRFDDARPDAVALLRWTAAPGTDVALAALPETARADVLHWLAQAAGSTGESIIGCIAAGRTADAVALGLVCGVVFALSGEGQAALGEAAIRLERFVNDRHVGGAAGRAWAAAAAQVVRGAEPEQSGAALDRADALLGELRAAEFAHLSDWLPRGLDQRLCAFAQALNAHLAAPAETTLVEVEQQADYALAHALLQAQAPRAERVEMARRLARWLLAPLPAAAELPVVAAWQVDEGAFVDWARFRLLGGDELAELSQAYGACRAAVIARRMQYAQPFAHALVAWNAEQPKAIGRLVPVESVLDQVLAPIAATQPVLLLVMDGLSISIFRELFARAASHGWLELVREEVGRPLFGVAALPTVTEISRASLLAGRLTLGAAALEKTAFAKHPALVAQSPAAAPPRLFHKGDLAAETNLAAELRAAIADPQQRVVGVVYNAVDDHLSGPDQLHQRWALEDLRLLLPLLREARDARRVLLVTADHGHLLEDGTAPLAGGEADRWRPGTDSRAPHEMAVRGGRVVTGDGANAVVCLWGEDTRYGGRKNGYHGGLAPQEVLVPLAVLAPQHLNVPGWTAAPPVQPEWWELPPIAAVRDRQPAPPRRPASRKPAASPGQAQLFVGPPPTLAATDWIGTLFGSSIYAAQRQLVARVAPPDDVMRQLLAALDERGGKLSRAALAQRLALPELRLSGLLSAARRLLNLDQAPVLVVDEAAGTVELNLALLRRQFRIEGSGGAP